MLARCVRILGVTLLASALWISPAFAQRGQPPGPAQQSKRKPVVQYIVVVILLGVPLLLVCRSSRRMS